MTIINAPPGIVRAPHERWEAAWDNDTNSGPPWVGRQPGLTSSVEGLISASAGGCRELRRNGPCSAFDADALVVGEKTKVTNYPSGRFLGSIVLNFSGLVAIRNEFGRRLPCRLMALNGRADRAE